jgi:hypothetical protein
LSGAEIEQAVVSGLYDAFSRGEELTTEDVARAIKQSVPLSATMSHRIAEQRAWSRVRARPASSGEPVELPDLPDELAALLQAAAMLDSVPLRAAEPEEKKAAESGGEEA